MAIEAPTQHGEQPDVDPVQLARTDFNRTLLGREYSGSVLIDRTILLQNALLGSNVTAERVYHELSIVSAQAADRAELEQDAGTSTNLRNLQKSFELTYETFRPRRPEEIAAAPQPTRTETLPPMTTPKGGEMTTQRQPRTRTPIQAPAPVAGEAITEEAGETENSEPIEETFASFIRQKRAEAGISQSKLGKALGGLNQGTISQIERGTLPTDPNRVAQLTAALSLNEEDAAKLQGLYDKQAGKNQEPASQ